jgi:CRP-like cAMP-binding protein
LRSIDEGTFVGKLSELLGQEVVGMDAQRRAAVAERAAALLARHDSAPSCRIVPFLPGRRPTDEASHPELGSSDQAVLLGAPGDAYVLYAVPPGFRELTGQATLRVDGETLWERPVSLEAFAPDGSLRPATADDQRLVLRLRPQEDLGAAAPRLGFADLYLQRARLELRLLDGDLPVAADALDLELCDVSRFGELYRRVMDQVLVPDTARQAGEAGHEDPGCAFHPWYPVLRIGSDKAALYTRALVEDIAGKQRHLSDPAWLMRIGIYLELLTCLGIFEAIRDTHGDLLTAEEREAFEHSEPFAEIRARLNPAGWREVWEMRRITFPQRGAPRTGPVSSLNLLQKKKATLAFLHVHHDDLKHAIELAGANAHNSQETWQRVFRDAERAVLRQTADAFPELGFLPVGAREFVLWHRRGRLEVGRNLRVPVPIAGLLADQDGLFTSACVQYRASMNHVADWAKERGLMDHTGAECIPKRVSLFEAHESDPPSVAVLQRRDGYEEGLAVVTAPPPAKPPVEDAVALLGGVPIFKLLSPEQLHTLARTAKPIALGPTERVVVQGAEGESLFVVADGEVEVVVRQAGGDDLVVDTMGRGAVVGEMALLTGERRRATVRAADGAVVYEIGRRAFQPLLQEHPEWIDELAAIMEQRLQERYARLAAFDAASVERGAIGRRIRRLFFTEESGVRSA